jgi:thiamine biosynthesis lipoprotein ApbE
MPADRWLSVTVVAPDATQADALATAFFVMDRTEIVAAAEHFPECGWILLRPDAQRGGLIAEVAGLDGEQLRWIGSRVRPTEFQA